MDLQQRLRNDLKQAMKDKKKELVGVIRLILSELKNYEIDNGKQDNQGVEKIISKMLKQYKEALEGFVQADREDLIQETKQKIGILKEYLPEQMSEQKLDEIIKQVISDNPDLAAGPVIGIVMKKVQGKADGALVAKKVASLVN